MELSEEQHKKFKFLGRHIIRFGNTNFAYITLIYQNQLNCSAQWDILNMHTFAYFLVVAFIWYRKRVTQCFVINVRQLRQQWRWWKRKRNVVHSVDFVLRIRRVRLHCKQINLNLKLDFMMNQSVLNWHSAFTLNDIITESNLLR